MKKPLIITLFFSVTSCVSVQIPKSMQEQMNRIEQGLITNTKVISQSQTQISKLDESYKIILKGIVKPSNVSTNYDNLTTEQLDSLRAVRGIIKKD